MAIREKVTSRRYLKGKYLKNAKSVKIRTETKGFGAFKTLFVMFLIALNFAFLLFLYFRFLMVFQGYLTVAFVLSLLTSVYVLSTDKNGQSKAVWIIILLVGFSFGYLLYFFADENVFFYKSKKKFKKVFSESARCDADGDETRACKEVENNLGYLKNAGNFAAYTGTDIKYFPSGAQFFDDVIKRLESAEKFVFIEFFIISDGVLFERVFDILKKKAQAGVDIRIIYDDLGSHRTLSGKSKRAAAAAGIKLMPFNRLIPRFTVALNYRDHRKIISIDGKTAYTGGCNLADEYINEKRMHGYWKDAGVRLDGRACDGLTLIFLRQWHYLTNAAPDYESFLGSAEATANGFAVAPYAGGPEYKQKIVKNVYANVIADANEKLYIMTPYFITEDTINDLLVNKALAGVDVRIILPDIPDKQYVYSVTRSNAERLIEYGVKVYCMKNSFVHSKIVLSEKQAAVGSANLDLRSFYQQFECSVLTDDEKFVADVFADFENTFRDCTEITLKNGKRNNFFHRVAAAFLRIFAPLM